MSVEPDSRKVCTYLRLGTPPSTVAISVTFAADPEIPPASFVESAFRALYNPCIPYVFMHDLWCRLSRMSRCRGGSRKKGPLGTPDEEIGAQGFYRDHLEKCHISILSTQEPLDCSRGSRGGSCEPASATCAGQMLTETASGRRGAEEEVGKRRRRPRRERMTADEVVGK